MQLLDVADGATLLLDLGARRGVNIHLDLAG